MFTSAAKFARILFSAFTRKGIWNKCVSPCYSLQKQKKLTPFLCRVLVQLHLEKDVVPKGTCQRNSEFLRQGRILQNLLLLVQQGHVTDSVLIQRWLEPLLPNMQSTSAVTCASISSSEYRNRTHCVILDPTCLGTLHTQTRVMKKTRTRTLLNSFML